jgi:hypothetical protein
VNKFIELSFCQLELTCSDGSSFLGRWILSAWVA